MMLACAADSRKPPKIKVTSRYLAIRGIGGVPFKRDQILAFSSKPILRRGDEKIHRPRGQF